MDRSILISISFNVHLTLFSNTSNFPKKVEEEDQLLPFPGSAKALVFDALCLRHYFADSIWNQFHVVWTVLQVIMSKKNWNWHFSRKSENKMDKKMWVQRFPRRSFVAVVLPEVMYHEPSLIFDLQLLRRMSACECSFVCQLWCINDVSEMQVFWHIDSQT